MLGNYNNSMMKNTSVKVHASGAVFEGSATQNQKRYRHNRRDIQIVVVSSSDEETTKQTIGQDQVHSSLERDNRGAKGT